PMAQPVSSPPPPLPTMEARPFGAAPMGMAYPAYPANAQPVSSATAVAPGGPDPMAPVGQLAATSPTSPTSPPTAPTAAAPAVKAPKRKRTRSNNNLSMVLAMAAVGMLLVAVVVMINRGQGRNSQNAVAKQGQPPAGSPKQATPNTPTQPATSAEVAIASNDNRTESTRPGPEGISPDAPEPKSPDMEMTPDPATAGGEPTTTPPAPASTPETPDPAPTPTTPDPTPPTPPTPEPPAPAPPATDDHATPQQVAALAGKLKSLRGQLSRLDFVAAERSLTDANAMPASANQVGQLNRLRTAFELLQQFQEGVDRSLAELKSLDELSYGGATISIVEIRPDELVIHSAGRNRTYSRRELPAFVGLVLADRVMPNEPQNQVIKGAYLALHPAQTPSVEAKARELLSAGIAGGVDAKDLLLLFDDKYEGASSPTAPAPESSPSPTVPAKAPTADEMKATQETLVKVREDLGKGNTAAASKRLDTIAIGTPRQLHTRDLLKTAVARLGELHSSIQGAIDELKPDDELNIPPDVTVKVVQVTQDKLRVELAGEPGTLDRTALPAALAVELAKRKLGDDGKSKVLTALYVNFHVRASATYRKQARQWLEEAGQDAELLDLFEEQE
ncbi:MAG: hypothetical protein KDB14_17730, partial [Planctomycetales bacterium]|nr:hypothetical protein [Planctomycetales bacterium]